MSWNYETSSARIKEHLDRLGDIQVAKLVKAADLDSLLSETVCREIVGAHVYVDVPNFAMLASTGTQTDDEAKHLVQAIHIFQREVSRIIERDDMFDGFRVHFQGTKLHALFTAP